MLESKDFKIIYVFIIYSSISIVGTIHIFFIHISKVYLYQKIYRFLKKHDVKFSDEKKEAKRRNQRKVKELHTLFSLVQKT